MEPDGGVPLGVQQVVQPTRLGIKHHPPQLVIEYFDGPKRRLHHVHLLVESLKQSTKHTISELKSHPDHGPFVSNLQAQQLGELLRRLRAAAAAPAQGEEAPPPARRGRGRSTPATAGVARRRLQAPAKPQVAQQPVEPKAQVAQQPVPWPVAAWRDWALAHVEAPAACEPADLFEDFRKSRGVEAIATSFAQLLKACVASQGAVSEATRVPFEVIRAVVGQQRRLARVLWERLDARRSAPDYHGQPLARQPAVVVGAGPVGMRCALELRLLGADVVVLERRCGFDRINRLHLWPWCGEDLKGWGAKVLEPPELSFGSDPDFLHIGIAELQMLLFKACLLLGVQVFFSTEYVKSEPADELGVWEVVTKHCDPGTSPPGPSAPSRLQGVSILVGADGPRGSVAAAHSLELVQNSGLRREAALGIVANYSNRQSVAEKRMRSFSLARQFYEQLFKDCEQQTGVALENIVCYIGPQTHYFVMTPTRKSLQQTGVLGAEAQEGGSLASLDEAALGQIAREVCAFPWKPTQGPLPEETLESPVGPPSLFDFSKTRRAAGGIRVLEAPGVPGKPTAKLLVALCGDALIEPFWPEGLGIIRGFFAALDLASATKVWVESGDDKRASDHFEQAYRQLKTLAAKTRQAVLRPEEQAYSLDPSTRYKQLHSSGGQARAASMPAIRVGR